MTDVNLTWQRLLYDLLEHGSEVAPRSAGADFGGNTCREMVAVTTVVPMTLPVVTVGTRRLGYRFMAAESAAILSGDSRVSILAPYSPVIANFSNDGLRFDGSYGIPFVEQVAWVVATLAADPASRQAVMTIWRQRPAPSRDIPCTVAIQWLLRGGELSCVVTMRSSDAWTGWPYDVHVFSMMSAYVALALRRAGGTVTSLSDLHLTAGSQHLYEKNAEAASRALADRSRLAVLAPFDLDLFSDQDDLIAHLWTFARRTQPSGGGWLGELR